MSNEIEFVRLIGTERRVGSTLESVSKHWQGDKETFLFISPHDDDVILGAGLMIQLAMKEGVDCHILIATDGSMGYCSPEQKDNIAEIRMQETYECYQALGIPKENIVWMGFPDCRLNYYRGRRPANTDDTCAVEGYVGLQNSFTHQLRRIAPTQVFLPTSEDLHPDHKIVHEELLISLFHASGNIWPELGEPIPAVPYVHEMGVYCDFPSPPDLKMQTPDEYLQRKIDGIRCFKSQTQIESLIQIVERSGPEEYMRALRFKLYSPKSYHDMFKKHTRMPGGGSR
ncbi:MAG: PIG-L family deacetylase [Phycisphaerae bacterium]|nr:PIG-L family deacetylase [Phycisphaerae bacterium]